MASSLPPAFKSLLSAFKRADELDRDPQRENRIVAYYIRYWAVSKAAKMMTRDPSEQVFVAGQLDVLEKISPQLNMAEGEGQKTCIQQASILFNRADEIDRLGLADKATAKLFYTAATIYDCLDQFGEIDPEILERRKYAKWKAADIVNAINSGERPTPGGFGEQPAEGKDEGFDIPAAPTSKSSSSSSLNVAPSGNSALSPQHPPAPVPQPPPQQQQPPRFAPPPPSVQQPKNFVFPTVNIPRGPPQSPADPRVKDSIELAQFAISALNHNNIALAKERLAEALRRLG